MSPSIKNIRRSVLAGGGLLLLVVAGFFGMARLKGFHFHLDLPGRLGADISQTANGFTYSQSNRGHTLFTIHASKLVQFKADQAQLHDVTITLYGPEGSGRMDKIYGSDFVYDRKLGIARATGAVRIDFASPEMKSETGSPDTLPQNGSSPDGASQAGSPSGLPRGSPSGSGGGSSGAAPAQPGKDAGNTIHVTTSGVVFNQATGDATTDQRVDFIFTRAAGSAVGASYNSKTGLLVLDSQVALTTGAAPAGEAGKGAGIAGAVVHAEHAQLLRDTHQAYLIQADTLYNGERGTSDQAIVTFRPDGSAQMIDARGHVHLTTPDSDQVHSSSALINLNAQSQPVTVDLGGGVTYYGDRSGRTMQGSAVSGTLSFASAPAPASRGARMAADGQPLTEQVLHHAQFRDAVSFVLQQHSLAGDPNGSSTREMRATTLDIDFAPGPDGKAQAQHALGVGGAAVKLHDVPSKAPAKTTTIDGDQLLATLVGGHQLRLLDGKGNTKVVDTAQDGATNTSTGDTLHVTFAQTGADRAAGASRSAAAGESATAEVSSSTAQVDTAIQEGSVTMTQMPAPDAKNSDGSPQAPLHATAARAEYHSADQVLHLTGDPHLRNDTLAVTADRVDYHRDSGDAVAIGNVKSTYTQQPQNTQLVQPGNTQQLQQGKQAAAPTLGGQGPVHIIADHAQMTRANNLSIFYGTAAVPARMWQGGDAVAAPVLELARDQQALDAHGAPGQRGAVVHAVLGSKEAKDKPTEARGKSEPETQKGGVGVPTPAAQTNADGSSRSSAPARLTSVTLHYSDKDRRADLHGSVVAEQPTGVVHSDEAQVFLTPNIPGKPSTVDHMIATGRVVITQPGRRGVGDRLVYTASDGHYVLTGSPQQPPRVTDAEKGTTTGAALIFKGADDSVEVSSHLAGGPVDHPTRTITDTHSPK